MSQVLRDTTAFVYEQAFEEGLKGAEDAGIIPSVQMHRDGVLGFLWRFSEKQDWDKAKPHMDRISGFVNDQEIRPVLVAYMVRAQRFQRF